MSEKEAATVSKRKIKTQSVQTSEEQPVIESEEATKRKTKVLFLRDFLYLYSDRDHPVTKEDIRKAYQTQGYSGNLNTIPKDIDTLIEYGEEIHISSGHPVTYYIASRQFSLPELRVLIDSVNAAQFISREHTEHLTEKLASLAGKHSSSILMSGISVAKTDNPNVADTTLAICQAIKSGKKVSFQYIDYANDGEKYLRHNGAYYKLSPYDLLCDNSRYYVIGWHETRERVVSFRIDMITNCAVTDENAFPAPEEYDPARYGREVIHMYDGERAEVTLDGRTGMMKQIIEHFGMDGFTIIHSDSDHFIVKVHVSVSNTFFSWVAQFAGCMRIAGPEDVRQRYMEFGKAIAEGK